ncbi:MAG TPA: hypothetical protein VK878_13150, partial [Candidatus Deferrimicrobiaceae bacterium]|nr:hypothetical protein [Candidatus Deferrimicrobiaceae bacterium]
HLRGPATASRSAAARIHAATAIDVGSGISGILKNGANAPAICLPPDQLVGSRPEERANRQQQAVLAQVPHDGAGALHFAEFGEDKTESLKMNRFSGRLWWWDEGADRFGLAMVFGVEFFLREPAR